MIRFSCPRCIAVLECDGAHAGGKTQSLKCGQKLRIPTPPAQPPLDKTMHLRHCGRKPAKNARILTWLEILSPTIPPTLTLDPESEPPKKHPAPGEHALAEKVPYAYECVALGRRFSPGNES